MPLWKESSVGDKIEDLSLQCFCDSDCTGDDGDSYRSTSGGWLELKGQSTSFPLTFISKRTAVWRSSCEAEMASADVVVRKELLPMSYLMDSILEARSPTTTPPSISSSPSRLAEPPPEPPRRVAMIAREDNQARPFWSCRA